MSFGDSVENTLGRTSRRRRSAHSSSLTPRPMRQAHIMGTSLGTGYLGLGAGVLALVQLAFGGLLFLGNLQDYPQLVPALASWALLLVTLVGTGLFIVTRGEVLPTWLFVTTIISMLLVIVLDFTAIWPLHDVAFYSSASLCASTVLLIAVTLRRGWEIVLGTALIGIAFIVGIALDSPMTIDTLPRIIGVVTLSVMPPLFGVYVVRRFRRLVQVELDRVLVQSTVSAPRFAVGMLASEELARLDLAAEELLDAVATGTADLPLDKKTSSKAASLATELRLHLIEGRRETWLYHAITESETLGKFVGLNDRGSLAGLLDPRQRDGLLSAVWLLVSDRDKKPATVQVTIGPVAPSSIDGSPGKVLVPIVLSSTGVARNRVGPATWDAFAKVGRYADSTQDSSLRVEIECVVDNPADR